MTKVIAILATLDTKSDECGFLAQEISRLGAAPLLIDIGVVGNSNLTADITATEIAALGGTPLGDLRRKPSRETASKVMVDGATIKVLDLLTAGKIHGIIGLGGTQGTNNCTQVMQAMPYGFPKVMLSTMASGDTSGYVGIKDITMLFSVADILGLNPLFRAIVSNAAGAVVGMATANQPVTFDPKKPVVGITNLGVLTQGTMRAMEKFAEHGFESIVFHAVGSGGRAMEQLMRDGIIQAVFDYALGDLMDDIGGGIRAADKTRLTVAAALGLPQVVVPGGTDHLGILLDTPNSLPKEFADRAYTYHNPVILVPRTSADEMSQLAQIVAERTNAAIGPTHILVPSRGLSSYSIPGGPLEDAAADAVLAQGLSKNCTNPVTIVQAGAEDAEFIDLAVATLVDLMSQKHGE